MSPSWWVKHESATIGKNLSIVATRRCLFSASYAKKKASHVGPLRDLQLFNQVAVDAETHTLVWPNGADFDPATLHDWPICGAEFSRMVQTWTPVHA
jgi:hypothetical protein